MVHILPFWWCIYILSGGIYIYTLSGGTKKKPREGSASRKRIPYGSLGSAFTSHSFIMITEDVFQKVRSGALSPGEQWGSPEPNITLTARVEAAEAARSKNNSEYLRLRLIDETGIIRVCLPTDGLAKALRACQSADEAGSLLQNLRVTLTSSKQKPDNSRIYLWHPVFTTGAPPPPPPGGTNL
jgi:hypothetical protein